MSDNFWVVLPLALADRQCLPAGIDRKVVARKQCTVGQLDGSDLSRRAGAAGTALALARSALLTDAPLPTWGGTPAGRIQLQATPSALVLTALAVGLCFFTAIYSGRYMDRDSRYPSSYPLLLLMLAGLLGMLLTTDLFNLYLFCELMSISAYVLVAFRRHTDTSVEAGFKYLILGSTATLIMLLGISWIYRETGSYRAPPGGRDGRSVDAPGHGLLSGGSGA